MRSNQESFCIAGFRGQAAERGSSAEMSTDPRESSPTLKITGFYYE